MRPWSNTMTSSTIRSVDSLWAMMNVVRPSISWATAASRRCSVTGSMRAVASSSTTRSGCAQPDPGQRQQLRLAGRQARPAGAEVAVDAGLGQRRQTGAAAARR